MVRKRRAARGDGTVHPRANGTFCGQIDLGLDPNGKRRRKTVYGRTEEEVFKKKRLLQRQLDEHGDLPTSDMTVEKWLTYWLDSIARKRLKPNTLRSYRTAVDKHLIPTLGRRPLSRLSPAHIRSMHDALTDRPDKPLSSTTARNAHRILSAALNDAVREGRVSRNVASLTPAPPKAVSKRTGLSAKQAIAVLRATADTPMFTRWAAALLLGARQGECLGLRWSHVDLDAGTIDLEWSLQRVSYSHGCGGACSRTARSCPDRKVAVPAGLKHEPLTRNLVLLTPKTEKARRIIPIPEPLLIALRRHLDTTPPNPYGLVWAADGEPIDPRDDWQAWSDALAAAKVPHVTLHEARHTAATLLFELGVDQDTIKSILGHSDVLTTRGYQHEDVRLAREALNRYAGQLELTAAGAAG